jgi:hypothetical protein
VGALPATDEDPLTLDKAEKLLGVAARAKSLFGPILGWLLTRADEIEWPTWVSDLPMEVIHALQVDDPRIKPKSA